ncbi:hypothetical protein CCMSSC00406_0007061 [Pleurotus cornucopiae]|uniref:Uncharacterized protein n=1 Tax=Pleurotus cornucopiae TaxID=5321 RepID=A0ACB7J4R3_PLECO|nr:hypothetical protein CCMSSC00406_0007061 [Pleurotus cornucopiae]
MVQLAYAYRVWILSGKNRYVTSALAFLTFSQFSKLAGSLVAHDSELDNNTRTTSVWYSKLRVKCAVVNPTVFNGVMLRQINGDVTLLHSAVSDAIGTIEFGSTVACDLLISASMAYYLNKHRQRSGIRRTENLLEKLIVYVIGIGLLTSIFAIIVFVTWVALPKQLIFLTFHSIISKRAPSP